MTIFVDSSAFLEFLDADTRSHDAVVAAVGEALAQGDTLLTTNYVILETASICQHRLGVEVTRKFLTQTGRVATVHWVNQAIHDLAVSALLAAGRRGLSLVDCTSFEIMRQRGLRQAFALDRHFDEQGFECLPRGLD